jgi:NAD(P)-dependent dehydrogenase (short-subunit alcohol dehydrogenase family)
MNQPDKPKTTLVTGAGSGIGLAVAHRLARRGDRVTGTVRDQSSANALAERARGDGLDVRYRTLELSSPESVAALANELSAAGGIDLLVHNAGYGLFGAVEEVDPATAGRQFTINLFGPLDLTTRLLPGLRERRGHIIWIGSLAGRFALPFQAHYSATKAAIASISDALRMELAPHGVRVTCIEPGDFATGFTDAREVVRREASPYLDALTRCLGAAEKQERSGPPPDRIAGVVDRVSRMKNPPARQPVGPGARTLCLLLRLVPDRVRERGVRMNYRL